MISVQIIEKSGIRRGVERFLGKEQPASVKITFTGQDHLPQGQVRGLFGWDEDSVVEINFPGDPNRTYYQTTSDLKVAEYEQGEEGSSLTFHDLHALSVDSLMEKLQKHMELKGSEGEEIHGWERITKRLKSKRAY